MIKYLICFFTAFFFIFNANAKDFAEQSVMLEKANFMDVYNQEVKASNYNISFRSGMVLNIWATWCKPCIAELPSLMKMQSKIPEVSVIAVSVDRHEKILKNFLRRNGIGADSYLVYLLDKNGLQFKKMGFSQVPTTLIIDNKGNIVDVIIGARKWDSLHMVSYIKAKLKITKQ